MSTAETLSAPAGRAPETIPISALKGDNVVEKNHIHDLGTGVLGTHGALYCLGVSPGTVLRNNYIHHVHAAVIESMGDVRIVGLVVAPDSMADFGRVRSEFVGRMQRHDLPFADGGCEIVSERRDAALAR